MSHEDLTVPFEEISCRSARRIVGQYRQAIDKLLTRAFVLGSSNQPLFAAFAGVSKRRTPVTVGLIDRVINKGVPSLSTDEVIVFLSNGDPALKLVRLKIGSATELSGFWSKALRDGVVETDPTVAASSTRCLSERQAKQLLESRSNDDAWGYPTTRDDAIRLHVEELRCKGLLPPARSPAAE